MGLGKVDEADLASSSDRVPCHLAWRELPSLSAAVLVILDPAWNWLSPQKTNQLQSNFIMSGNLTEIKFRLNQRDSQRLCSPFLCTRPWWRFSPVPTDGRSPCCSFLPQPLVWLLNPVPSIPTASAAEAPFQMIVVNRSFPRGISPAGIAIQCCCFISSDCRATRARFILFLIVCQATVSQKHQPFHLILPKECML